MKVNITILMLLWSAASLFSSCQKDAGRQESVQVYTISAKFEAETRTSIDENNRASWTLGDKIWLSTGDSETATFGTVIAISESGAATIQTSLDISGKEVYAAYPYSTDDAYAVVGDSKVAFEIPAEQDGRYSNAGICIAVGTRLAGLVFRNATAMMKVVDRTPDVGAFVFEKENIAGTYVFSYGDLSVAVQNGSDKIVARPESGTSGPYYVCVAPGVSYSKDETIAKWCKANGACLKQKKSSVDITLLRSRMYNLGTTYSTIDGTIEQ